MAIFKCKMCGGSLEISEGISVATCEYCGTKQTVPKSRGEIVTNLFNRANNLRLKCEFDKAEQVYEKILDIDNTDSEAHWGIVLCKYGIEYVEDPKTYSRIPTCHRTLYEAVLTDVDYLAATQNADAEQKELYKAEAELIDDLQKNILSIVNNEEPFDVFICYKETDEDGKRTVDSTIANDIYYQLTQEGFKVFYAPITLENKLGHEYEPYIFAALNSAKVMLVVGTKPEYFDSVWVRNEWSRFIKLTKTDRSKMIIPCYRNMDAYELPEEFAHLQAQDMGKIGFITDVIRGLKKVFERDVQAQPKIVKKKVKKPSKIKPIIKKLKQKIQECAKGLLMLLLESFSKIFYFISVVLYFYFGIKVLKNLSNPKDVIMFSLLTIMGILVTSLISFKVIKDKRIAIILQGIVSILFVLSCFVGVMYMIEYGFYLYVILSTLLTLIWFIIICFTKKSEEENIKRPKKARNALISVLVSLSLIFAFEIIGKNYFDYQLANMFNSFGAHKYASEYFVYLGDYRDSADLATKLKLNELKNAELLDDVYLGDLRNGDIDFRGKNSDLWCVIAKEENKVLLLNYYDVSVSNNSDIVGGWKNSTIRRYLNGEFYRKSFNRAIKDCIISTELKNSSSPNDITTDKIFILSIDEYNSYLRYDENGKARQEYGNICLRDVEDNTYTYVDYEGHFQSVICSLDKSVVADANGDGYITFSEWSNYEQYDTKGLNEIKTLSYCPAMWIDLNKISN